MKICFLLTHIPNPRINKRLLIAKELGDVFVVCARRKSQDAYVISVEGVDYYVFDIDLPSSQKLISRYYSSQEFQAQAKNTLKIISPDIVYAEGLDSLIIANQYVKQHKNVKVFYEVADLRECFIEMPKSMKDSLKKSLIATVEKRNFKIVDYLVVTSEKFYEMHYRELIDKNRVIYVPNIPNRAPFAGYQRKTSGDFTVGFIGGIRYLQQMKMLVDAATTINCKVLFAGAGGTVTDYQEIKEYCSSKRNVSFTGKYNYDTQIADLYSQVDCVYAVYDADNPNVKIALPNKLYESVLCRLPIIVSKGTYLGEIVEREKIGIAVGHMDCDELEKALIGLKNNRKLYSILTSNCIAAEKVLLNDSLYNEKLRRALQECL